jgi:hypothetical protein
VLIFSSFNMSRSVQIWTVVIGKRFYSNWRSCVDLLLFYHVAQRSNMNSCEWQAIFIVYCNWESLFLAGLWEKFAKDMRYLRAFKYEMVRDVRKFQSQTSVWAFKYEIAGRRREGPKVNNFKLPLVWFW